MLVQGSRGEEVLKLQQNLESSGFNPGPRDGIFGPLTAAAVRQLQSYCGLTITGNYSSTSKEALKLLLPHQVEKGRLLSKHFCEEEFACHCCGIVRVNIKLITLLEELRAKLGNRPITITSGYRCPKHNTAVGGVKNSQHLQGNAADIVVAGVAPAQVTAVARETGFTGLGLYKAFSHLDVRRASIPASFIM